MRIKRKFKGSKAKDNKGYLKSNSENFTPFKEIDGGDITMKGVELPLIAIPMEADGEPQGMKFMKPGEEYKFAGAHKTMEIPVYKKGGKSKWIDSKIKELVKKGYTQNDALLEAQASYKKMDGGFIDSFQIGGLSDLEAEDNLLDATSNSKFINEAAAADEAAAQAQEDKNQEALLGSSELPNTLDPIEQDDPFQFFNPYQGVDIPTAANLFGQGIGKGGDPKLAVAAGAKLALGLGRNITSGLGQAKSTEFAINEFEEKNRQALIDRDPLEAIGQDGGELTASDKDTIRKDVGFDFNDEYISDVFEKVQPAERQPRHTPNLGRYKGLDYFKTKKVQGNKIQLQTQDRFPGNPETMNDYVAYLRKQNPGFDVDINYNRRDTNKFRDINAIEDGTRMSDTQFEDADAKLQGGGMVNFAAKLQEGGPIQALDTVMLKKYMSKEDAATEDLRALLEEYKSGDGDNKLDMSSIEKRIKERDKAYKTLDSVMSKAVETQEFQEGGAVDDEKMMTGHYSNEAEEPGSNVEVEENEYILSPSGKLTKVLGDTHEEGGEKLNLEEGTRIVSDHLKLGGAQAKQLKKDFDIDVKAKDTYAKSIDKFYKKSGLQSIIDEEEEVIKTIKDEKTKLAEEGQDDSTRNINLEFLSSKLNDLDKAKQPLMAAATMFFDKAYELQEKSKPVGEGDTGEFQIGGRVYLKDEIVELGKKYNLGAEEAQDLARTMQAGGILPSTGAAAGEGDAIPFDPSKGSPIQQHRDPETGLYGEITPEQFEQAKVRNDWFDWTNFDVKDAKQVKRFQTAFNKRSTTGAKIKVDGKFGIQTQSVLFPISDAKGVKLSPTDSIQTGALPIPLSKDPVQDLEPYTDPNPAADPLSERGVYLTPDQELLPPGGMVPHTKIERRYGRLEAPNFTVDQQLAELNRGVDAAMDQIANLPSGQQEAAAIQLQANKQTQSDKLISENQRAEREKEFKVDAFNIRQGDREVDASAIDTLSFEQRSLGALANTEDDIRRYFNEGQRRNVEKFKEIESLNFMNALYENFDITSDGIKNTVGSGVDNEDLVNKLRTKLALKVGDPKDKVKKKAYGGKLRYKRR